MLTSPFNGAPACRAKTRRGTPCLCPAMPNGRCKLHGGKTPSGPASVHFIHGRRSRASEETSKIITQLGRLSRMVEKVPPGQPMTPVAVELYADLRERCWAQDLRRAEWRRILEDQGR
jgi:hypothetical protein